jgi:hypothetical protein
MKDFEQLVKGIHGLDRKIELAKMMEEKAIRVGRKLADLDPSQFRNNALACNSQFNSKHLIFQLKLATIWKRNKALINTEANERYKLRQVDRVQTYLSKESEKAKRAYLLLKEA